MLRDLFGRKADDTVWVDDLALKRLVFACDIGICGWWMGHDMLSLYRGLKDKGAQFQFSITQATADYLNRVIDNSGHLPVPGPVIGTRQHGPVAMYGMRLWLEGRNFDVAYVAKDQDNRSAIFTPVRQTKIKYEHRFTNGGGWTPDTPARPFRRAQEGMVLNILV